MANKTVDPRIRDLCARVTKKRPRTVIDHILKHGHITTEDLQETYGYDHPPRAARDVREEGVPLETYRTESARTGRQIAAYRFADPSSIRNGRIGGRKAFSKSFKDALVSQDGERDAVTGQQVEARYLQIDHRIPYEVAGDAEHDESDLSAYMLLDASSQRAKSWSCEHCQNWISDHDESVCSTCYWAFPEAHTHVAMKPVRRVDLTWLGQDVRDYERLRKEAALAGTTVAALIKTKLKS